MLAEAPFNDEDIAQINAGKKFEKFLLEKTYLSIAASFILAFIGIRGDIEGYLIALVILLLFFVGLPFSTNTQQTIIMCKVQLLAVGAGTLTTPQLNLQYKAKHDAQKFK